MLWKVRFFPDDHGGYWDVDAPREGGNPDDDRDRYSVLEYTTEEQAFMIEAAVNSHLKNCKDPLDSAKSDILGRAIACLKHIYDNCGDSPEVWKMTIGILEEAGILP